MKLTGFHLVLQSGGTVDEQLLEGQTRVRDFKIQQTHHLGGMMEIENLGIPIVRRLDEIQQDIHHLHQEFSSRRETFDIVRQDIWEQEHERSRSVVDE